MMQLQKFKTWPRSYDDGFYGTVFFDRSERTAIKIFKMNHDHNRSHIESTYRNEMEAYALATVHPEAQKHVPKFYGPQDIASIIDEYGNNISDQYYPELNFKMEFIEGDFQKFSHLSNELRQHYALLFIKVGIHHYSDCNFVIDKAGICKFIDISTKEIIPEW